MDACPEKWHIENYGTNDKVGTILAHFPYQGLGGGRVFGV